MSYKWIQPKSNFFWENCFDHMNLWDTPITLWIIHLWVICSLRNPAYTKLILITGAYSCLRVVLVFARQLSFFIFTIYIPCFMIVIVSWMSFWIDHKAVSFFIFLFWVIKFILKFLSTEKSDTLVIYKAS